MKNKTELELLKERCESAESILSGCKYSLGIAIRRQAHFDKFKPKDELREMWRAFGFEADIKFNNEKVQKCLNYRVLKVLKGIGKNLEDEDFEWTDFTDLINELIKQHGGKL